MVNSFLKSAGDLIKNNRVQKRNVTRGPDAPYGRGRHVFSATPFRV